MLTRNKFSTFLVGGSTALLLTAAGNVSALDLYSQSGSKGKVINSYGECWGTVGGSSDICGSEPMAAAPVDSDGDGVYDDKDQCPNTPKGAPVDAKGCPLDTDGDGVFDYMDKCPNTPAGTIVDASGCMKALVLHDVTFELDSANLTDQAKQILTPVANSLKARPDIKALTVTGHTDSTGSESYNQTLSENRAAAVATYLKDSGVPASLSSNGMGESSPIAGNDTACGRAANRRVELSVK